MKKANVFGAVLCSAALAVGMALPAFAADKDIPAPTGTSTADGTTAAETIFTGKVMGTSDDPVLEKMIKATVPLNVTVAIETTAQAFSAVPTNYAITNTGEADLQVSSMRALAASGWALRAYTGTYTGSVETNTLEMKIAGNDITASETTLATPIQVMAGSEKNMSIDGGTVYAASKAPTADTSVELVTVKYTVAKL